MLDVHPPHHATHTWRDFFIHIATIVVGLLIAVGLEQTVEAIHHHHQRRELVEALLEDTKKRVRDSEHFERDVDLRLGWVVQRIAQVRDTLYLHQALPVEAPYAEILPDVPVAPSWTAANSSGLLAFLSQDEVRSFGEAAGLATAFSPIVGALSSEANKVHRLEQRYIQPGSPERYDYSEMTPVELREYLDQLLTLQAALHRADLWLRYMRGADAAVLEGSRNLQEIEDSEMRYIPQAATQ